MSPCALGCLCTTTHTEAIFALTAANRAEVDELVHTAIAAGGAHAMPPMDHGFMHGWSFYDPDGHHWEVFYMDPTALPLGARLTRPRAPSTWICKYRRIVRSHSPARKAAPCSCGTAATPAVGPLIAALASLVQPRGITVRAPVKRALAGAESWIRKKKPWTSSVVLEYGTCPLVPRAAALSGIAACTILPLGQRDLWPRRTRTNDPTPSIPLSP